MKLNKAVPSFLNHLELQGFSSRSIRQRRSQLNQFVRWCEERSLMTVKSIQHPHLEAYQRYLFHVRQKNGRPLSRQTQHHRLVAVSTLFQWLLREGKTKKNPAQHIELPRIEKALPKDILNPAEVAQILDSINVSTAVGLRDRTMIELMYSTGLRRAEMLSLDVSDIDFERELVWVRKGKGNKDRLVPMGSRAIVWLDKYLEEARPQWMLNDAEKALFLSRRGKRINIDWLSALVKRIVDAADLPKKGACHLFRHSMATSMLDNGADIRHIQEMLGHSDIGSTQIYTRVSIAKLKEVHTQTHPAKWKSDGSTQKVDDAGVKVPGDS